MQRFRSAERALDEPKEVIEALDAPALETMVTEYLDARGVLQEVIDALEAPPPP